MMKKTIFLFSIVLITCIHGAGGAEPTDSRTQIVLIFDASGSMWGRAGSSTKIAAAKKAILSIVDDLSGKPVMVALRIYGHRNRRCSDTNLEMPMGPIDPERLKRIVMPLKPRGKTPIAISLLKAADDFIKSGSGEKVIILVTDGIETCGGDPCEIALKHQAAGIVTRIHVVGFGMKQSELSSLKCVVQPSGGLLLSADNQDELYSALEGAVAVSMRKNLIVTGSDKSGRDVFIQVTVSQQGQEKRRSEGNDVGFYLDPGVYDITVREPVTDKEVVLEGIAVDDDHVVRQSVSFGEAVLSFQGRDNAGKTIETLAVVYDSETGKTIKIIDRGSVHSLALPPGQYDIELQDLETNVKETIKGVSLKADTAVQARFRRGHLVVKSMNTRGIAIKTNVEVFKNGYPGVFRSSPGKTVHEMVLPEGDFRITVKYWYSRAEETIPSVTVSDGGTVEEEVIINTD